MVIEFSELVFISLTSLYLGISYLYKYIKNISTNYQKEILNFALFISILCIVSLTLFPIRFGYKFEGFEIYNIIPFKILLKLLFEYSLGDFLYNFLGNIALFIPFGFFVYLKLNKDQNKAMLAVFFTTLSVEIIQGFIPYRFCEIDDIILNTLGGYIGIIMCNILILSYILYKRYKT